MRILAQLQSLESAQGAESVTITWVDLPGHIKKIVIYHKQHGAGFFGTFLDLSNCFVAGGR